MAVYIHVYIFIYLYIIPVIYLFRIRPRPLLHARQHRDQASGASSAALHRSGAGLSCTFLGRGGLNDHRVLAYTVDFKKLEHGHPCKWLGVDIRHK